MRKIVSQDLRDLIVDALAETALECGLAIADTMEAKGIANPRKVRDMKGAGAICAAISLLSRSADGRASIPGLCYMLDRIGQLGHGAFAGIEDGPEAPRRAAARVMALSDLLERVSA